jgi:hypothetical protein
VGATEWLTPHFAHRVPSLDERVWSVYCGMGDHEGDVRNSAAHCESGDGMRMEGKLGMEEGAGKGGGYIHVAKLPAEFIEDRGSGP